MAAVLYNNLSDTINKSTWEVRIPDSYEPTVAARYMDTDETRPIYVGSDSTYVYSRLSIYYMMDMTWNNIPFTIINKDDVILIGDIIEQYTALLFKAVNHIEDETHPNRIWLRKAKKLHQAVTEYGTMAIHSEQRESAKIRPKKKSVVDVLFGLKI